MIIKCNSIEQENSILEYIGKNYGKCLYLYLDLKKYTIQSDNIQVYQQICNGEITAVLLCYYSCLHIFSEKGDFDTQEIKQFLLGKQLSMIYCEQSIALKLLNNVYNGTNVSFRTGWVAQIQQVSISNEDVNVMLADKNDFSQIAQMIYDDEDIGRSYNFDDLVKQLTERSEQGFSRNYVIKKDDNIVIAHACTNAEFDNIAVVGELLVRKEYRRKGYASKIWKFLCGELLSENKEVYSFYYTDESRRLHTKTGFFEICNWSKILLNK